MKKKIIVISVAAVLILAAIGFTIYYFGVVAPEREREEELLAAVVEYRESKLKAYAEENARYADGEVDVAFLGDSLTDGCNLEKYYPEYLSVNRGIGGDKTFDLEERLEVSLYELKPKVAVMLIGGNNLDTMFDNYERILSGIKEKLPAMPVVLVSLTAMGGGMAEKNSLAAFNNAKIKALSEKYGYSFVDIFTPLLDIDEDAIRAEYTNDGVHLTNAGYEVVSAAIKPTLDSLLSEPRAK